MATVLSQAEIAARRLADAHVAVGNELLARGIGLSARVRDEASAAIEAWNATAHGAPAASAGAMALITAERDRHLVVEGWTPEHDELHSNGELANAAACYACTPGYALRESSPPMMWPWAEEWWKPGDRVRELVKAGALIAAEIDRLSATMEGVRGGDDDGE